MAASGKANLSEALRDRVLFIDGGWGASIAGFHPTEGDYEGHAGLYDYLVFSRPDIVEAVHRSFLEAGCDIIETNTFSASAVTLEEHGLREKTYELNQRAAEIARTAADRYATAEKARFVAGSIGPGAKLPTLGHTDFDELEAGYFQQAAGLIAGGVDYLQIETCQDIIQAKAALLGSRRACREAGRELPVALLLTMEKGKTLLGTDVQTAVATFAPFDLLAFGINCSTGPAEMEEPLRLLADLSPFPIIVMPNAGFPRWKEGQYAYDLTPAAFARVLARFIREYGVRIAGGCCGTTAAHLQALIRKADARIPWRRPARPASAATSLYSTQYFQVDLRPLIIGERTNASGSKKFREALLADDWDGATDMAIAQQEEGAHLLDLSLAYAGRSEERDYGALVPRLNRDLRIPVCFDTTDPQALAVALKRYAGRAVVNSINLEDGGAKADRILELASAFGASVICLCIDEKGMAQTAGRKLEVAKKILARAAAFGLRPEQLFFDALTFSLATGDPGLADSALETLAGIAAIKEALPGAFTVLGVSNVSYGFPPQARQVLNSVFLFHAVQKGLDAAILHAGKVIPLDRIAADEMRLAENLIFNRCETTDPLHAFLDCFSKKEERQAQPVEEKDLAVEERLREDVLQGRKKDITATLELAMKKYTALRILSAHLLVAMKEVGERFAGGKMQLPFVLKSAETMRTAIEYLEPHLERETFAAQGSMVLATVRGDIHDIGKNLVDIILKNNGFQVYNIGKDKSREEIIAAIRQFRPQYLGLSGLLVKSTLEMKELLQALKREGISLPVICGGAALRREFVDTVLKPESAGQVFYAADAFEAIAIMSRKGASARGKSAKPQAKSPPRQVASIRSHIPPRPPFWGKSSLHLPLTAVLDCLDRKTLYRSRWKITDEKQGDAWLEEILDGLPPNARNGLGAVYGHFHCRRRGEALLVTAGSEEILFSFPAQPQAGKPPLTRYFREDTDLVSFFVASAGPEFSALEEALFRQDQYQRYLLLHGFGVQLAEAAAAFVHDSIRRELGLPVRRGGRRYSPGYPAWPALADQRKIFRLLEPESIGLRLSPGDQLIPEQSVSAMIVYHPQARY